MSIRPSESFRHTSWKFLLLLLLTCTGCSEWRAKRHLEAARELEATAEDAFLSGEDSRTKQLYERALFMTQKAESLSKREPVQAKASEIASRCQRHLSMFEEIADAGQTILACLQMHHAELSHYLDFSTIADDILPEGRGGEISLEDRLSMVHLFGAFMTTLMSSGNPFEVATCEIMADEQKGQRTLCHVTCTFAGTESDISFAFGRSEGGRWKLRDFIIHGLGISCMSAFRDAVIAMEEKVPFETLAQGDREHMRKLENVYHRLTDKGGDEVIYRSYQGRHVEIIQEAEILDDEGKSIRTAQSGEQFFVVREIMKEGDVLWLSIQLPTPVAEADTGWIPKETVKLLPLAEQEVWGLL